MNPAEDDPRHARPSSDLPDASHAYHVEKVELPLPLALRDRLVEAVAGHLRVGAREVRVVDGVEADFDDGRLMIRPRSGEPRCGIIAASDRPTRARELLEQAVLTFDGVREGLRSDP